MEDIIGYMLYEKMKNFFEKVLPFFFDLCYTVPVKRKETWFTLRDAAYKFLV